MAAKKKPKRGLEFPRTGNGRTGGAKPKKNELMMLRSDGRVHTQQPDGWVGKVVKLFKS